MNPPDHKAVRDPEQFRPRGNRITYDDIRNTTPRGMEPYYYRPYPPVMYRQEPVRGRAEVQPVSPGGRCRVLRAWQGVLFFIVVMTVFYFLLPIPMAFLQIPEIPGIIIQQLYLLLVSVLFVLILKEDLRTVFPIRKPNLTGIIGIFVIYIGLWLIELVISTFLVYVAGDQLMQVQETLFGDTSGVSYVILMILISVLPAFCEEALNRGVILHALKSDLHSRTLIILISGLLFGIAHFYPVRMLAPTILGFVMAWIMLETDNLFYTGLLHMMNNGLVILFSAVVQAFLPEDVMEQSVQTAQAIGGFETGLAMMMYGLFAPLIVYCGCFLIRRSVHGKGTPFIAPGREAAAAAAILIPLAVIFATACIIMVIG